MPERRRLLRSLRVGRVDLVPKGANPKAHIALSKQDAGWEAELEKAARERVAKSAGEVTVEQAKVQLMHERPDLARAREAEIRNAPKSQPHPAGLLRGESAPERGRPGV